MLAHSEYQRYILMKNISKLYLGKKHAKITNKSLETNTSKLD